MKKINKVFDHKWWFYDLVKWAGIGGITLFYRHKKLYESNNKPKDLLKGRLIICSNHVSYEDAIGIVTTLWQRRISFMVGKQMVETHKAKHFFRGVGSIGVDANNIDIDSIKKAIQVIDRGHVVGIFPEGKISPNNELLPFKSGAVMCAFLAKADILPIYISKRKSKKENWVMIIGDRIKIDQMFKSQYPTIDEINSVTNYLNKKEKELQQIYINKWLNRKAK